MQPLLRFLLAPLISIQRLIPLLALVLTLFYNRAFFHNLNDLYGETPHGLWFIAALAVLLFAVHVLMFCLLCFRYTTKAVMTLLFLGAAAASYYMNRFNIVIDSTMLTNVLRTDPREAKDLLTVEFFLQLLLLGLLPSVWLWRTRIHYPKWTLELRNRVLLIVGSLVLALTCAVPFTAHYATFLREHKLLRYYANPATFIYGGIRLAEDHFSAHSPRVRTALGLQAKLQYPESKPKLVILVVGEAARADHFSLNGYNQLTNPLLATQDVIFFSQVTSCGTATAYSVPCMFSQSDRSDFDLEEAESTENVLDILQHAGVAVLWRDNNSDSKGVARAVEFQDYRQSPPNTVCDDECRDVGMLEGLEEWISMHQGSSITIVLHQMGNHGPAYYKRYPPEFARFQPTCLRNELEHCGQQEIINSYDNALLYTDFFLNESIEFLKRHEDKFATALFYMADHGESLGENGLYLHGLPFRMAPDSQKHVGALMWFGNSFPIDTQQLRLQAATSYSHDEYFHTVLGLLQVSTPEYEAGKDWLSKAIKAP